jgi:hypothetical protein
MSLIVSTKLVAVHKPTIAPNHSSEEGEERDDRKVSEVAGVDEAVVVNADRDPLDDLPRGQARLELFFDVGPKGRAHRREALAPFFR